MLLPNLRQYGGSKHFKGPWWRTDSEPPVFDKELQWDLKQNSICAVQETSLHWKGIRTTWRLFWITQESLGSAVWLRLWFLGIMPLAPQITRERLQAQATFLRSEQFSFIWDPGWRIQRTLGSNIRLDANFRGPNYSQEPLASEPCKNQWRRSKTTTSKQLTHKVVSCWNWYIPMCGRLEP